MVARLRLSPRASSAVAVALSFVFAAYACSACKPTLDQGVSGVTGPVVLAVRSEPAEGAPGTAVKYTALYVDTPGPGNASGLRWDFCEAREPLAELGPVNTDCEELAGPWFVPIGHGAEAMATLPNDGCKLFGPDVPPPVVGQPQGRPVDPDPTGGYYDPVRIVDPAGAITIAETRLSCGAGVIPADVGVVYEHRYHANVNPTVASLSVIGAGDKARELVTSDRGTNPVQVDTHLVLRVAWAPCPTADACGDRVCGADETDMICAVDCAKPAGCTGAERFVVFDLSSQGLAVQRESIAAAWYATAGSFDADRTGRAAADFATTSDNGWSAPLAPGVVHLWVVLRDVRGGVGWAEYALDVR